MNWTKRNDIFERKEKEQRYTLTAPGKMARNSVYDDTISIEAGFHYNGSGGMAFGGAATWPHAQLNISFEEGRIADRDAFIKELQKFVANYFDTKKVISQ